MVLIISNYLQRFTEDLFCNFQISKKVNVILNLATDFAIFCLNLISDENMSEQELLTEFQSPSFISHQPRGKDHFDGSPHVRIANSLSEIISSGEKHTHIIGLEGEWGSGKSNVIKILEKEFQKSGEKYVFTYDLWGHQEDIHRKSFLEELLHELSLEQLLGSVADLESEFLKELKGKSWNDKLEYLLSQKKKKDQSSYPTLGLGLVYVVLYFFLIDPLINAFGNNGALWGIPHFKIVFNTLLLGVAIILSMAKKINLAKELMGIVKGKFLDSSSFEIVSDRGPSVFQFKNWMNEIDRALNENKLVIVFDNLDRLDNEKLKEVWSLINTFFSNSKEYQNIWVIVPYDRVHVQNVYGEEEGMRFISKTFPLRYQIPTPILSNWRKFFEDLFSDSFGNIEETREVASIYGTLHANTNPREIIDFINEMVSLHKVWKGKIPVKCIALYILKKDSLETKEKEGPDEEPPTNKYIDDEILYSNLIRFVERFFKDGNDVRKYIAALYYNIDPEDAIEVLLFKDVSVSVHRGTKLNIKVLIHRSSLRNVLEAVLNSGDFNVRHAVNLLSDLKQINYKLVRLKKENEGLVDWNSLGIDVKSLKSIELLSGDGSDGYDTELNLNDVYLIDNEEFVRLFDIIADDVMANHRNNMYLSGELKQLIMQLSEHSAKNILSRIYKSITGDPGAANHLCTQLLEFKEYLHVSKISGQPSFEEISYPFELRAFTFYYYILEMKEGYRQFQAFCDKDELEEHCLKVIQDNNIKSEIFRTLRMDKDYPFDRIKEQYPEYFPWLS